MKYEIGPRTIIGAILLATGAVILAFGLRLVYNANVSTHWPSVDGQIISSSLQEVPQDDSISRPRVIYGFFVNKDGYVSSHLTYPSGGAESQKKAAKIIARYPAGKTVKVYYNPVDPSESVLEPGELSRTWDTVAIAILCLFAGRLIYCNPRKKVPRRVRDKSEPAIQVHVEFDFDLVSACLWVLSAILSAPTVGSHSPTGLMKTGAFIVLGIAAEALWRRSWRMLRADLEGFFGVLAWQITLIQCGVTGFSLSLLTFVVASTAVVVHKIRMVTKEARSVPANLVVEPEEPVLTPIKGRRVRPRAAERRSLFYMAAGSFLCIAMMILRKWAEDDGSSLQPVYAWLAALAFLVIVAGALFGLYYMRCVYCDAPLPEIKDKKTQYVRCTECGQMNPR